MAQHLSPEQARANAEAFLQQQTGLRSTSEFQLSFAVSDTMQLDAGATLRSASGSGDALLYAFSRAAGGYVIAAGDERAHAVLGYSTEDMFDGRNLPEGLRAMLRQYAVEIATLRAEGDTNDSEEKLSYDPAWPAVEPMITADWGQEDPYNRQVPVSNIGASCVTGCPATMFAQLMDYYQYQNWKVEEETWYSGRGPKEIHRNVTVRFDSPVDWSLLKRNYTTEEFTEAEANEVAKLMKYTGAAMHIDYGYDGSGVDGDNVLDNMARVADYGLQATYAKAWQYSLRTWSEKLYKQLAAGRPMPYASLGGGHIFLMDGYAGKGYFHFNWGWNGDFNGNYLLSALLTEDNMQLYQCGIFDCIPSTMQPVNEEPVLLRSVDIDLSGEIPALKLVLASLHSGVQTGQMRLALVAEDGSYSFLSDTIDFTFTPNAEHASGTISVPFPEYAKLTGKFYVLVPVQRMGEDWQQILMNKDETHHQVYLLQTDNQYRISYEEVGLEGTLVNPPSQIPVEEDIKLTLEVTNLLDEMTTATFEAMLYNDEDRKQYTLGTKLCAEGRQLVELMLNVSELKAGKYKLVVTGGGVSTDPVDVELVRNAVLVITEVPTITDLQANKMQKVTYKVKNVGPNPFVGTLYFYLVIDDPKGTKVPVIHHQEVEIAVEEEKEIKWSFPLFGKNYEEPNTGYFLMDQSGAWQLNCEGETDPYHHPVNILSKATANEEISSVSEATVSWQGRTLCVESALPMKSYYIYKVNGEAVATGSVSGTSARIDGSSWPQGVYIVAIVTEAGKTVVYKIRV
ncbi:MAG: C10 family peptidase [Parabacteroides sp.]|nr:C10 family peptidase [Parabacteroides sp.]